MIVTGACGPPKNDSVNGDVTGFPTTNAPASLYDNVPLQTPSQNNLGLKSFT